MALRRANALALIAVPTQPRTVAVAEVADETGYEQQQQCAAKNHEDVGKDLDSEIEQESFARIIVATDGWLGLKTETLVNNDVVAPRLHSVTAATYSPPRGK